MSKPLRIGVVGLGKMGQLRSQTVRQHPDTILVSATDPRPPARGFEDVRLCAGYQDVIASGVDAVFVCTPNRYAPEVVVAALNAGKHVFCEKPPGRTLKDVERILEAERNNPGRLLKFGFNHRYHFGIMEAKRIVDSGQYGKIMWMRGIYGKGESSAQGEQWRNDPEIAGGGILLDQGIHMLDLFRHFCGDFHEIKSMCTTAYWDLPMEDNAFALLRDGEGRIAMLHSSFTQWKHRFSLEIYMTDGFVQVDGMPSTTRSYRDEWITHARKHTGYAIGNPPEVSTFCNTDPSWEMELEEFVSCIQKGEPVRNGTSRDAYEVMRMVHGIYEADRDHKRGLLGQPQPATPPHAEAANGMDQFAESH
jgi:predicted dehydrogenase